MLGIGSYRGSYRAVVSVLARRIVTLAEESSIHSSEVPDIDETPSAFSINSPLEVFVIETAWLADPAAPDDPRGAGACGAGWWPFPSQEQPLAQLVGRFAQRADLQAEFCALTTVGDRVPASRGSS
jgi:hypothetical protein